jgi:hypothetical protein
LNFLGWTVEIFPDGLPMFGRIGFGRPFGFFVAEEGSPFFGGHRKSKF